MSDPNGSMSLGEIAAKWPAAIDVFERHGMDYCCGGSQTLAQACEARALSLSGMLQECADATSPPGQERCWTNASLSALADHIEQTHHAFVRQAIAKLDILIPKVAQSHGGTDARLSTLAAAYKGFRADMLDHMVREERVVFPWLRRLESPTQIHRGPPWSIRRPISCMVHDHDDVGETLAQMRVLTDAYAAPAGACGSYRAMLATLAQLDHDTRVHIHKENNILFPAGVRAEEALAHPSA